MTAQIDRDSGHERGEAPGPTHGTHPGGAGGAHIVPVAALRRTPGSLRDVVVSAPLGDLSAVGVAVPDGTPVTARLHLASYAGGIMVTGRVQARWSGECRRCGGPVAGEVDVAVRERFAPERDAAPVGPHPVDADDEDAYPLLDDELDLAPLVRDAVLLELPLAPLCSPDCRGICPQCGANRNEGECGCEPPSDPRWSALDALRGS